MDKVAYLDSLRNEVEQKTGANEAYIDQFINATSQDEMISALSNVEPLTDPTAVDKAINILQDVQSAVGLRVLALYKISYAVASQEGLMTYVIRLIGSKEAPPDLRIAAFTCVTAAAFASPVFTSLQPLLLETLRGVVSDSNLGLREKAITYLAQSKDEYVQRVLIEGIKEPAKEVISQEKAVHLLGYDIHAGLYPLLHDIVQKSSNNDSRAEALHILGTDPGSKDLLLNVFKNRKERFDTRMSSILALKTYYPDEFESTALDAVSDENENAEMRAVCVNALSHNAAGASYKNATMANTLTDIRAATHSTELKKAIDGYFRNTNNSTQ